MEPGNKAICKPLICGPNKHFDVVNRFCETINKYNFLVECMYIFPTLDLHKEEVNEEGEGSNIQNKAGIG